MQSSHLILWPLAEDLFAEAKRIKLLCVARGNMDYKHYYRLIATGLFCLETLLQYEQLNVNVEIRTRFRMAEVIFHETNNLQSAEQILNKGIILAQRKHENVEIKFAMQHLLVRILTQTSPKTAKILLKSCIAEAEELCFLNWVYIFCFLQFNILSCSTCWDVEHATRLSVLSKILLISERQGDHIIYIIASLLEIHLKIEMGDYLSAKKFLDNLSAMQTTFNDISILNLIKMVFNVFLNIMQGCGDSAASELKELHNALDTFAQYDSNHSFQDFIELSLNSNDSSKLVISWFSKQQLFVYGYLLAGICHLPDYSSSKAEVFLDEGLKILKYNLIYDLANNLRTNRNLGWFDITREICLIYYCFALILRSNFDKAFEYIQNLEKHSSSFNTDTKAFYMLLKGIYAQFTGQLNIALKAYNLIPTTVQTFNLLGSLNSVLIFQGNKFQDKEKAYEILNNIKSLCQSSNYIQLRFAWDLINSSAKHDVFHSKDYLSSIISAFKKHANNQLRVIASVTLCYYFIIHSESEQAEKMLISAYLLSKNAENDIWAFMSGKLLEELMKRKNKRIKAEKQSELNLKHKERISNIFNNAYTISVD
ncbi:hypothetical protein PORY_002514 [Pneumocystis oryctolagi]|uniref:Uncharacterized protein n=1 Tax=Pneumocystis oryctolagi TaxID=42067 RepID=A0ACB7CAU4_9ASCO|nr:hypothetical protein PORY_002514 [Pneumocystis oryctolagi]